MKQGSTKKLRRKGGRKGKQVELLMLVIMFLPGLSISKASYDIKYPRLSKTTCCLVLQLNGAVDGVYMRTIGE